MRHNPEYLIPDKQIDLRITNISAMFALYETKGYRASVISVTEYKQWWILVTFTQTKIILVLIQLTSLKGV